MTACARCGAELGDASASPPGGPKVLFGNVKPREK